ncbi:GNAT family N-acetyltransferase [Pseudoalteromonas sp. MMG005]|uniref:GNAT family N-acetyltransferase n=1 Tax=Pseudoalteromonas sp. MMG005 TaxID=2822682 RepID=UPI001B3A5C2B|nr:GNAT family N-acetyltransferase [Pseudoalteromonas sp. MMG005]MBQ4847682.1 GNAT family N-acetyltransferase [Pseudoalteromonas sp. MMG005]
MIRLANINDLIGVLGLYEELRPHDPVLELEVMKKKWAELIDDEHSHIIVAEAGGKIAATCALGLNRSIANGGKPFAIIEHVVTGSGFRRRGFSRQVLEYAVALAWQLGCCKVMLLSGEKLTAAHRVYESVGFKSGIEKGFVIKPDVT